MKAITIRQPWATLIALGVKTIETRSWRAPKAAIGQTIAIHAGKKLNGNHFDEFGEWTLHSASWVEGGPQLRRLGAVSRGDESLNWEHIRLLPLGAIVATATLADCVPMVSERDIPTLKSGGSAIAIAGPACPVQPCVNWLTPHPYHGRVIDKDRSGHLYEQLPYGNFQPGRWAWMLTDVKPTEPIPAKGKQGLWEWTANHLHCFPELHDKEMNP